MLRKLLENQMGQVSNSEFETACHMAKSDIVLNRICYRHTTNRKHVLNILQASIEVLRRSYWAALDGTWDLTSHQ